MSRNWWGKFLFLLFVTVMSVVYLYPTFANLDLEKTKFPFKQKINLGLDLQGGLYMVLGIDFNNVFRNVVDRQASGLEARLKEKNIPFTQVKVVRDGVPLDDPRIDLQYDSAKRDEIYKLIKAEFWSLRVSEDQSGKFQFGLSTEYRNEVRERTLNQSIGVIRNRIDEFGVTEPSITSQGNDRVVVELPGVKEVERAKDLIGRTAKLELKLVADKIMDQGKVAAIVQEIEKSANLTYKEGQKFSDYAKKVNELAKGMIPENTEIAFERVESMVKDSVATRVPYLLNSKTEVTGDDLQDAQVQFNQENHRPSVGFSLNPRGASLFEKVTGEHTGERLAIVLDNIVHSAPVIQGRIGGGRAEISLGRGNGEQLMKEAKDLAIVLRAGALPAQLDFLEQRVIGPSLGADSIRRGGFASVVGVAIVFLFTIFYYRLSGGIAVVSLILNALYVLAILVGMEATLTLPGIAGIALTIGIAVDSNVVIYERIREELRSGKNIFGAVDAGFQKAFHTIMDANVANAIGAIVLLSFGTGPIKGFATTMLIGIVTTLFTAVFVCRVLFDFYLKRLEGRQAPTLSI